MAGEPQIYLNALGLAQPTQAFASGHGLGVDASNFNLNAHRVDLEEQRMAQQQAMAQQQFAAAQQQQAQQFYFDQQKLDLMREQAARDAVQVAFDNQLKAEQESRLGRAATYKEKYDQDYLALRRWESNQRGSAASGGTIDLETGQFIPAPEAPAGPSVSPPVFHFEQEQAIQNQQPLPEISGMARPLTTPEGAPSFQFPPASPATNGGSGFSAPLPSTPGATAAETPNPLFGQYPQAQPQAPQFGFLKTDSASGELPPDPKRWLAPETDFHALSDADLLTAEKDLTREHSRQEAIYQANREQIMARNLTLQGDRRAELKGRLAEITAETKQRNKAIEDRKKDIAAVDSAITDAEDRIIQLSTKHAEAAGSTALMTEAGREGPAAESLRKVKELLDAEEAKLEQLRTRRQQLEQSTPAKPAAAALPQQAASPAASNLPPTAGQRQTSAVGWEGSPAPAAPAQPSAAPATTKARVQSWLK